jgi:hypothetical protein
MTGAFDFPRQVTLAARTVSRLAARTNLAAFGNVTSQRINVFIIEAFAFGAVFRGAAALAAHVTASAPIPTISAITTITVITAATPFAFAAIILLEILVTHEFYSPGQV